MKTFKVDKTFTPLFLLCLFLGVLPIAPGQHFHAFIVPAFFYYCATHQFSMKRLMIAVLVVAVAQYIVLGFYYQDMEIDPGLKQILMWEKPAYLLLLTAAIFIMIDKITISISAMVVIVTCVMFLHTLLTLLLLRVHGGYTYVEFVLTQIDTTLFYESVMQNIPAEHQSTAKQIINWCLIQMGTLNIMSNLIYTLILSRLFYKRFAGVRNEVFLGFRLPRFMGFVFLLSWGVSLSLFFSGSVEELSQVSFSADNSLITPITTTTLSDPWNSPLTLPTTLFHGAVSVLIIFSTLYSFQGLSCFAFFFKALTILRNRLSWVNSLVIVGCVISLIFIFSIPVILATLFFILFLVGFIDQWRDFRGFGNR